MLFGIIQLRWRVISTAAERLMEVVAGRRKRSYLVWLHSEVLIGKVIRVLEFWRGGAGNLRPYESVLLKPEKESQKGRGFPGSDYRLFNMWINVSLPGQLCQFQRAMSYCSGGGIRFWSEKPSRDYNCFPSTSFLPAVSNICPQQLKAEISGCCQVMVSAALQFFFKCHFVINSV